MSGQKELPTLPGNVQSHPHPAYSWWGGEGPVLFRCLGALLAAIAWLIAPTAALAAGSPPTPPHLSARGAAVIDANTLQLIWQDNGHAPLPMASTTKMMTALVALEAEHDDLSLPMTVPPDVLRVYGERVYLQPGEVYSFGDLLRAMLVASANDAAVTIAVNAAGSQDAFVRLMNEKARQLSLEDTHFVNPHGLDAVGQYSSAVDLAVLGAAALHEPVLRSLVSLRQATLSWPGHPDRQLVNHNLLLGGYPGATGVKIGYTSKALNCVVGSAERDGHEVVAVVMGEAPRTEWRDESTLLNYGFEAEPFLPPPPPTPAAPPQAVAKAEVAPIAASARGGSWYRLFGLAGLGLITVASSRRRLRSSRLRRPRSL